MGIKGFKQFLRSKFPHVLQPYHISHLQTQKIAIDILPYLYKYKASMGDNWRDGILSFLLAFMKNNIHITVFIDGPCVTIAKKDEQDKRRSQRSKLTEKVSTLKQDLLTYQETGIISDSLKDLPIEASTQKNLLLGLPEDSIDIDLVQNYIEKIERQIIHIGPEDVTEIVNLCKALHISFYMAKQEAESLCSYLCNIGKVDAVVTEDSDVMAYGCRTWISSIDFNGDCLRVDKNNILDALNWTYEQLVDFCIMCGTDYNSTVPKIGPVGAYQLITEHKSIEEICKIKGITGEEWKTDLNRQIFLHPCDTAVVSKENHNHVKIKIDYLLIPQEKKLTSYLRALRYQTRMITDYYMVVNSKIVIEE